MQASDSHSTLPIHTRAIRKPGSIGQLKRSPPKRIQYNLNRKWKKKDKKLLKKALTHSESFSQEEDQRILDLVLEMGPKFVKIANYFPGKTYSMVKNRYYKHLRDRCLGILQNPSPIEPAFKNVSELDDLMKSINLAPELMTITQNMIRSLATCMG